MLYLYMPSLTLRVSNTILFSLIAFSKSAFVIPAAVALAASGSMEICALVSPL